MGAFPVQMQEACSGGQGPELLRPQVCGPSEVERSPARPSHVTAAERKPSQKGKVPLPLAPHTVVGRSLAWAGSAPWGQALPSSLVPQEVRAAYLA